MKKRITSILILFLFIISCNSSIDREIQRPNFIIFIADDISWDDIGAYGNKFVSTPNIDNLAKEGLIFNNMYLTTSSCSPSRNSIMTGRYPHNHGAPELHTQPPMGMKTFAEELNSSGYYTVSSGKWHIGDYARPGFDVIHEGIDLVGFGGEDQWVNILIDRPKDKPFFIWAAAHDPHRDWAENDFSGTHKLDDIIVPDYLIDDLQTRQDLAHYYDEIKRFDYFIGEVISKLKDQNVYDNTILMIMSDNGRPFPHSKTRLNDQGVKTPFIFVYNDEKILGKTESLVSVIDIAPTILDYAGIDIKENFQGKSFRKLLENPNEKFRNYVFAEHNWHDYESHQRMVKNENYMLIQNNRNEFPQAGPLDAINSSTYASLLEKNKLGEITEVQGEIFDSPRLEEEFYVLKNDLFQRKNLIDDDKLNEEINNLRLILNRWKNETGDSQPEEITKDWYLRTPGPIETRNNLGKSIDLVKTKNHGIRGEFPGSSNNATENNNKGPF